MPLQAIYAHLACSDFATGARWFERLFGRPPDKAPMPGLVEWHHGSAAGFQLFEDGDKAGVGTLTLRVSGLDAERARLEAAGLAPGGIKDGDFVKIIRLNDPDGNLVVLAE